MPRVDTKQQTKQNNRKSPPQPIQPRTFKKSRAVAPAQTVEIIDCCSEDDQEEQDEEPPRNDNLPPKKRFKKSASEGDYHVAPSTTADTTSRATASSTSRQVATVVSASGEELNNCDNNSSSDDEFSSMTTASNNDDSVDNSFRHQRTKKSLHDSATNDDHVGESVVVAGMLLDPPQTLTPGCNTIDNVQVNTTSNNPVAAEALKICDREEMKRFHLLMLRQNFMNALASEEDEDKKPMVKS